VIYQKLDFAPTHTSSRWGLAEELPGLCVIPNGGPSAFLVQDCHIFSANQEYLDRALQLSSAEDEDKVPMRWGRREYRAKAFDYLSRAESIDDPEQRADMLGLARMWMSLSEPLGDLPGAYEYPSQDQRPSSRHR